MKTIYLVQTLDTEDQWLSDPIPFTELTAVESYLKTEYPGYERYRDGNYKKIYLHPSTRDSSSRLEVYVFTVGTY
jgi:hypothetical protein